MGPRCSSAETQVCHMSYIIAARSGCSLIGTPMLLSSGTPFKEFLDPPLANTSSYQKMLNDLRKSLNNKIIARITAFEFLDKSVIFPLFTFDHSF